MVPRHKPDPSLHYGKVKAQVKAEVKKPGLRSTLASTPACFVRSLLFCRTDRPLIFRENPLTL
jgi:hypothetical protein